MPIPLKKESPKTSPSTAHSFLRKEPVKKRKLSLKPVLLKKNVSRKLSQEESQDQSVLFDEAYSQDKHCIALIEDPLWKWVCADLVKIIGFVPPVRLEDCRLDELSGLDTIGIISCSTEDTSQFLEEYVFVILAFLRQYFPRLKELRVSADSQ